MTSIEIQNRLVAFKEAAISHAVATEASDYRLANESADKIRRSVNWLDKGGARTELSTLLEHDCIGVRIWSAAYLLNTELSDKAVEVLTAAGKTKGVQGFDARTTLDEWKKGTLKI